MDKKASASYPTILISLFLLISLGVIILGYVITNKPLLLVNFVEMPGLDYIDYFRASTNILDRQSPYQILNARYVTTPIPALLNTIFVPFGFELARNMMFVLIPLSVVLAIFIASRLFPFSKADRNQIFLGGVVVLLCSYPFHFLLNRANIDGWVLLFICAGLFFHQKPKKEWLSGLFFSLAIVFKIYPVLILIPVVLYRRWKLLMWCVIGLVFWGLLSSFWFLDFQDVLLERSQNLLRLDENGSLYATTALIFVLLGSLGVSIKSSLMLIYIIPFIVAISYALMISIVVYTDFKAGKDQKEGILPFTLYIPFMMALPQTVYHYSFIVLLMLIPTICFLWQVTPKRSLMISFMMIGLCMTQWQAIATSLLTQNVFSHAIPGLGLLLLMVSVTIYKLETLHQIKHVLPPVNSKP